MINKTLVKTYFTNLISKWNNLEHSSKLIIAWFITVLFVKQQTHSPWVLLLLLIPIIWKGIEVIKISDNLKIQEIVKELDEVKEINDKLVDKLEEQDKMLSECDEILDSQVVSVPCVCGDNMFKGILSPTGENEVVCEKCNNTFVITVNHEILQISEVMKPGDEENILKKINSVQPIE